MTRARVIDDLLMAAEEVVVQYGRLRGDRQLRRALSIPATIRTSHEQAIVRLNAALRPFRRTGTP